jgi:hypothetical protein
MTASEITETANRTPFRKFEIRTSSVNVYQINKREEIGWTANVDRVFFFDPSGGYVVIDTDNITEVIVE